MKPQIFIRNLFFISSVFCVNPNSNSRFSNSPIIDSTIKVVSIFPASDGHFSTEKYLINRVAKKSDLVPTNTCLTCDKFHCALCPDKKDFYFLLFDYDIHFHNFEYELPARRKFFRERLFSLIKIFFRKIKVFLILII